MKLVGIYTRVCVFCVFQSEVIKFKSTKKKDSEKCKRKFGGVFFSPNSDAFFSYTCWRKEKKTTYGWRTIRKLKTGSQERRVRNFFFSLTPKRTILVPVSHILFRMYIKRNENFPEIKYRRLDT